MTAQTWSPGGKLAVVVLGAVALWSPAAVADQYHYNNILIGTRAVGMGGAFGAVADDASGVFYNPAGLAFALSNDISGSANAYYKKTTTYKSTIGGQDFVEESSGSVPSFFGGLQKLDKYVDGLVFAFAAYSTDSDLKEQDTLIEDLPVNGSNIETYYRTSTARASTSFFGASAGLRVTNSLALGFGLTYLNADELAQEYQNAVQFNIIDGQTTYLSRSSKTKLVVHGIQAVLGAQMALPANMAVGLTVKPAFVASQRFDTKVIEYRNKLKPDQKAELPSGQEVDAQVGIKESAFKSDEPIGGWPLEARLGWAWFASQSLLIAVDAMHYGATPDGIALYKREAITNFALGTEYYLSGSLALRAGIFTNYDARPKINEKKAGQPDHIDYIGESVFFAWIQPNSQIALGATLQQGSGQAQKLGTTDTQDVKASMQTFAFSATHNL